MTFKQLQIEVTEWGKHNFPDAEPVDPLLGAQEEIGELSHAHLKMRQGIRGTFQEHQLAKGDALADCIIFLAHYCALNNLNLQAEVETAWASVKERDWKKYPKNGVDE